MSKQNVKSMVELARQHVESGGIRAAEIYYRMIHRVTDPPVSGGERVANGEACWFFAKRMVAQGLHGAACDWYQKAIFADPLYVDYKLDYIINALLPMNMMRNAKILAQQAIRIEPDRPDCWRALAIACSALGEVEEAEAAYDRQLELDPDNPLARLDRATVAINTGDYEVARRMAIPVLDTDKGGEALHTLALIAYRDGEHERAIELYEKALDVGVQDPAQVKWNKSLACHAIGRYEEGWELAENRGIQKADQSMRLVMNRLNQPVMTRVDLAEPCRIHVHQEMGNGDAIAMARYLDLLTDLGHAVTLETLDSLVDLFARSFPKVKVVPRAVDYPGALGLPPFPPFDKQITTLSLPHLFATTVETVPWRGPYLKADPELVQSYINKISANAFRWSAGPKIGLCWSSGIRTDGLWISRYGKAKSMRFADIAGVWQDDAVMVCLQVGPERAESPTDLVDVLPAKPSWDDTAALIANLDLVITVDTAVAHLAGALGKPTFLMMQRDGSSWHFMCARPGAVWNEASPWYPSIRIFRQKNPGDWSGVIDKVAGELRKIDVEVGTAR